MQNNIHTRSSPQDGRYHQQLEGIQVHMVNIFGDVVDTAVRSRVIPIPARTSMLVRCIPGAFQTTPSIYETNIMDAVLSKMKPYGATKGVSAIRLKRIRTSTKGRNQIITKSQKIAATGMASNRDWLS